MHINIYAYDSTEHLKGIEELISRNVRVSPAENLEIHTKGVTPTATY